MNRDVYSIILGKAGKVIDIMLQNVTGKWARTPVHEDQVRGYGCCKCILVLTHNVNPAKQESTRLLDTFEKLVDVHVEGNQYRLLPLKCQSTAAFAVMLAVTSAPGTPFSIDHRIDHVPYRCYMSYKSPVRAAAEKFFACQGQQLPLMRCEFDAVLNAPESVAFIVVKPALNLGAITHYANMMKFVTSPALFDETGLDPVPWNEVLPKRRFTILATETPVPSAMERGMHEAAAAAGIVLYQKKGHDFQYMVPPAPAGSPPAA
jgi:hypothetical protein